MALSKTALKTIIKNALTANVNNTNDPNAAIEALAAAIADAIAQGVDTYVTTATVTNIPALTSPSGPVTGTIATTIAGVITP